ncbi:MAG: PAS domain-containing protein [Lachnospiraceae bacterium]|nr:PAS domain-containing protein [Lachnospiraceae bacterium]
MPDKIEQVKQEASRIMHCHYCENDFESVIDTFVPEMSWFGAGENQYLLGAEKIATAFRTFKGEIPPCRISGEEYDAYEIGKDLYVCSGRLWVSTDLSIKQLVRVHQRLTFVFKWTPEKIWCQHIHCSNPYQEMVEDEVFPEKIGQQSYEYVKETIEQLQEEMKNKNEQISVIVDTVSGGIKCSRDDESYSYTYVSEEAAALFGYTVDEFMEVTKGSAVGAVYPEDLPRVMKNLPKDFAVGPDYAQKYRVRCKDGSVKWILDRGRKTVDAQGETVINSLYMDITNAEMNEQKYLEQRELLSSIYDTVPCGILRLKCQDGVYQLISMNPAAGTLLGLSDNSLQEWTSGIPDTVLSEDRSLFTKSYNGLKETGDHNEIDYRVRWKDGSEHILHGSNHLISFDGKAEVFQCIFVDITESKALQDAYQAARQGNAAKSEFLSQMSHDMRTPMNAIMGLNALAMKSEDLTEIKDYLAKMQLSSQLLLNLINDVLDTEKIETNTLQLVYGPYSAEEFTEYMEVFLRPLCEEKKIHYTIWKEKDIPPAVLTDKTRLNQIMTNLLSNAVKFTPDGGEIELSLNVVRDTKTHLTCQFVVKDTGIGMTKEYLEHICEPFSRESRQGYGQIEGTGLGLAITKGLVKTLGGTLSIQSEVNKGSIFSVELTFEKCIPVIVEKNPAVNQSLAGKRILLCEDNEINAEIATKILEFKDIEVEWAKNGLEGVKMFEQSSLNYYDAILMDIRMPEMDGLAATRRIRFMGRKDAQTIPIIAMTANAFAQDRKESKEAGMNTHLAKPIQPEELYRTLSEVL